MATNRIEITKLDSSNNLIVGNFAVSLKKDTLESNHQEFPIHVRIFNGCFEVRMP